MSPAIKLQCEEFLSRTSNTISGIRQFDGGSKYLSGLGVSASVEVVTATPGIPGVIGYVT
jgi:hypothetical protein